MKQTITLLITTLFILQVHAACNLTINSSQDIQTSLNQIGANKTLCLEKGTYYPSTTINMLAGQTLRGLATDYEVLTLEQVKIKSNADRIIRTNDNVLIRHISIDGNGSLPTYGILAHYENNVTYWSLKIEHVKIAIGNNHSNGTEILNTTIENVGDGINGAGNATPAIWINSSNNVHIYYGSIWGSNNPPHGDGEIGVYDSNNVLVEGTHLNYSGTSSLYMVNCDNCSAVNLDIRYSGGWGLDIVQGSDNFIAYNNSVRYSHNGAAVFFEFDSIGGTWSNNTFINNNTSNNQYFCEGINVKTNPNNITLINNTSTGQLTCPYIF